MTATLTPEQNQLIDSLVPDLKPLVEEIEHGIKTTQNHYGRYLSIILGTGQDDRNVKIVVAFALVRAGANVEGVKSALALSS